ncbi:hypothetical protein ACQ4N7_23395 [Nodosilinea sp. AN01ver1]|uniref:hypothetical protein n=1 Tax=Nodosilinea sp. AN01ver1 TaxID=3423362 RepID=UPI003D31F5B7
MKAAISLALGGLVTGCAIADAPTTVPLTTTNEFAPGQQPYGVEGGITQQQLVYLQALAWPQSYTDMVNNFGFPTYRTETGDYYQLEGSNSWIVIEYSGPQATGYRTE